MTVFGCKAYVLIPKEQRTKMDVTSWQGTFLGYSEDKKGYRIWKKEKNDVIISRDVTFQEDQNETLTLPVSEDLPKEPEEVTISRSQKILAPQIADKVELPLNVEGNVNIDVDRRNNINDGTVEPVMEAISPKATEINSIHDENIPELRRSQRLRNPPQKLTYNTLGAPDEELLAVYYAAEYGEPLTLKEAMESENNESWKGAIESEMKSLHDNQTWDLTDLPPGRTAIGSKWLFKIKKDGTGNKRFKARLVAKGFAQKEGIDYKETFAPVIKFQSLRILLAIANNRGMFIHQLDITTAFLNGFLEEDIYMFKPEGQITPGQENKVCKLKRSLYGLKQSPRCWNKRIHSHLTEEESFGRFFE